MGSEVRLDVRPIPIRERHPRIFSAFDELDPEQTLVVTSDHEPRPLHAQFEHLYGAAFTWKQRDLGDGRWEVRLQRLTGAARSGVAGLLAGSPLFAALDEASRAELVHRGRRTVVRRHRSVIEAGVLWPYCAVVESGIVTAVLTTAEGRDQALYDVLTGEMFGEIALLDGGFEALRYVATTQTASVVLLPSDLVRTLADRSRAFACALEMLLAQRYRSLLDRMGANLARSAVARVAKALLAYAAPDDELADALSPLPAMTHAEIALSAGTVKEVVSRALSKLEENGALVRLRGHIVKLARSKLVAAAEDRPEMQVAERE